jgi:hypothetical protein
MSVDITIGDWSGNYTHNVSKLWHEHLLADDDSDTTGWDVIAGKTGKEAFHMLRAAFALIEATKHKYWKLNDVGEPAFCARYDASNGCGSTVGGLIFMAEVMAACAANPDAIVDVSL